MRRFEGRVAVVTGGSRGIGLAVARRLVAEGADVVVTGRDEGSLAEAVADLGAAHASGVRGRADDPDHCAAALAHAVERFGRLDHLVNNAGINPAWGPLRELDLAVARKILEVNVVAALGWTRAALDAGLTRSVVNLASLAGTSASPDIAFYGVSKAALVNLTAQLAFELAPDVRVNAVAPGIVRTRLAHALYAGREAEATAAYPLARLGEPDDVAGPVAFLLSDDAAWVTGQTLKIDGGASIAPVG